MGGGGFVFPPSPLFSPFLDQMLLRLQKEVFMLLLIWAGTNLMPI